MAEQKAENEAKTAESTKQWFIDYCSKFNIDYEFDDDYTKGSFLTLTGKSGQKYTEGMDLQVYFESGDKKALEKSIDEFYNKVQAVDTLASILKFSYKCGTDDVELITYTNSRHRQYVNFDTIYSNVGVCVSYGKNVVFVQVIYDDSDDIRDTTITLGNGVELVMEGTGYDAVYMTIQKTVKVKTDKLDTLVDEVKKVVNQIKKISVEDN